MQKNEFDATAPVYDEILPLHISRHYLEKRICFFLRYLKPNSKILDVGCGTGRIIASLLRNVRLKAYGCDSSFEMSKIAQDRGNIRVTCCISDYLPYTGDTFDTVISIAVFHHLSSEEVLLKTIREMIRVTRRGGKVIIWDANSLNPYWLLLFKKIPYDQNVKRIVPLRRIILEAKKLNLTNIEVLKSGWIPDFAPKKMLSFFIFFEYIMEHIPVIKLFSAHNIIVFTK